MLFRSFADRFPVTTKLELSFSPLIQTTLLVSSVVNLEYGFKVHTSGYIISPTELLEPSIVITTGIHYRNSPVVVLDTIYDATYLERTISATASLDSVVSFNNEIIVNVHTIWENTPSSTVRSINQEIIKSIPTGFSDLYADSGISNISFVPLTLGNTLRKFESGSFVDSGFASVSGISLDQFDRVYGNITIEDFDILGYFPNPIIKAPMAV